MDWNPNRPKIVGLEFAPTAGTVPPAYRIDAAFRTAIQRLKSTTSETIGSIAATMVIDPGCDIVAIGEVIVADDAVSPPITTTVFRPTAVLEATSPFTDGDWRTQNFRTNSGSTDPADIVAVLQRTTPTHDQDIRSDIATGNSLCIAAMQFDTAGVLDGQRIVDVRVVVTGFGTGTFLGTIPPQADDYMNNVLYADAVDGITNAANINAPDLDGLPSVLFASGTPIVSTLGEMLPTANATPQPSTPWRTTDLDRLDASTGDRLLHVSLSPGIGTGRLFYITSVYIEVDHVPENRLAFDLIRSGGIAYGNRPVTWIPHQPDGTAHFAKTAGQDLLYVLRRAYYGPFNGYAPAGASGSRLPSGNSGDYSWSVPYIESFIATGSPDGLAQYPSASLNADGTVAVIGTGRGDRISGMDLRVYPSGIQSIDAQPWDTVLPVPVSGTVEQEISDAGTTPYDGVQVPVRYTLDAGVVSDLGIQLKRRSDNAVMGTATLTKIGADAFPENPVAGWRLARILFDIPATLAAATQYYLAFTTGGTGSWDIPAMAPNPTIADLSFDNTATYDGNSDVATFPGYSSDVQGYSDIAAFIYIVPDSPTGLTATATSVPTGGPTLPAGAPAGITAIGQIDLAWDLIADTGNVIEIQRSDDVTPYTTIYMIPGIYAFISDWEARIGMRSCYRIRVIDPLLGLISDWSPASPCAIRGSFGCGYTFATNVNPSGNCAYSDVYDGGFADRVYDFPEATERVFRTVYGRPYQIGFRPPETRGVQFTRTLLLAWSADPAMLPGPVAASSIQAIARDPSLPYVCVLDESGNRWFAAVDVPSMTGRRPGELYYGDVVVTEVTATPSQALGSAPPIPGFILLESGGFMLQEDGSSLFDLEES